MAGQIRPPKENERYFALLRVEAINRGKRSISLDLKSEEGKALFKAVATDSAHGRSGSAADRRTSA